MRIPAKENTDGHPRTLAEHFRGRFGLFRRLASFDSAIQWSNDIIFKYFRLSLKPILQLLAVGLPPTFIELLGARANFPLDHLDHQRLLFLSASFEIHLQILPIFDPYL